VTRAARRAVLACATAALAVASPQAGAARYGAAPAFTTYHEPGTHEGGAEPSIGVDWETGTVMYQSRLRTLAVTFDARGVATWEDRTASLERMFTLDPILYTDPRSGRTWVSQLAGTCSLLSFTDDGGRTWTPSTGCGPGAYADHQTVGAGPKRDGELAVYYCAHGVVAASCARSDDGGLVFGPAVPIYSGTRCAYYHGHLRVAPDGTVLVPNPGCGGDQALVVSEDDGLTWEVRPIPGTNVNVESDPSVAAGSDNTVYFGFQDGEGAADTRALVAVSRDHGRTWSRPVDVSSRLGLRNVQFPEVIAGDGDRAAFAFLGTKASGDDQSDAFKGEWRLYVALTYDRGQTWTTVNATPGEIVQRGCIDLRGCSQRNLLDFNDIAVDRQGRVHVAWADGCPRVCEQGAAYDPDWHTAVISRQSGGKGLFRAYDGRF
jgi:hypothetical protein